jgi:drug/metabolite transporter (DMT)-like permease
MFQSSSVFVFIFSMLVLRDPWDTGKAISVTICMCGVSLIAIDNWDDASGGAGPLILLLIAALLWGLYEVLFAKMFPGLSSREVLLFVGFRGGRLV